MVLKSIENIAEARKTRKKQVTYKLDVSSSSDADESDKIYTLFKHDKKQPSPNVETRPTSSILKKQPVNETIVVSETYTATKKSGIIITKKKKPSENEKENTPPPVALVSREREKRKCVADSDMKSLEEVELESESENKNLESIDSLLKVKRHKKQRKSKDEKENEDEYSFKSGEAKKKRKAPSKSSKASKLAEKIREQEELEIERYSVEYEAIKNYPLIVERVSYLD